MCLKFKCFFLCDCNLYIRSVREGYCAVVIKLLKKFPFGNPILKSVQILNPENRLKITETTGKHFSYWYYMYLPFYSATGCRGTSGKY